MDSGGVLFVLFLCSSECSLTEDHRADVLLLLDGFTNITSEDFSKVTEFLDSLVQILGVFGLDSVQFALVKCDERPEIEFDLNTYHDVSSVVGAVKKLTQSPASAGDLTSEGVEFVRKTIFDKDRGARDNAPDALILISDRNSSGVNRDTVIHLWSLAVKVLIVGVKEADYSELKDVRNGLDRSEVFTVQNFTSFPDILNELTQSFCRWIKHKLDLVPPAPVKFSDVQSRRARVSWTFYGSVEVFYVFIKSDMRWLKVWGDKRTTELLHLKPNTDYEVHISAYKSALGPPAISYLTTQQDSVRLSGDPGRCSGSLEVLVDQMWSSVCAEDFGQTEAEVVCRELDCGGVSELQRALFTEGSAVGRSFHCNGAETALKDCESSETRCSAAANITCSDDVTLRLSGDHCEGFLMLRHEDQWRDVKPVDREVDLDFGSVMCQQLGCGLALRVSYKEGLEPFWWLDPECVKQRAGLRHCLVHDENNTQDMDSIRLMCSDHFPNLTITVSSEDESQSLGHMSLVRSGANFTVSCSLDGPFRGVHFLLFSPTGNYTLPAVNHSAHFKFAAFGPAHSGNYTCGYKDFWLKRNMKYVSLHISLGVPDSDLILRAVIHHVLILLITTTALCFYCQPQPPTTINHQPPTTTTTTTINHPQPQSTTHNHQPPTTTINHPQPQSTTHNHNKPPTTTINHPQPSTTHNHPQPQSTTHNHN
ncbi:hypothetical protein WMY93_012524 [Mugilogobius chulae]|uniref:Uncharacterized protein n=1 Tax=Mugilogobius chulae TaxID=88201 RepID=A0AAW0PHW0_9GOBI